MIPAGVDMNALAAQLDADRVAYSNVDLANDSALQETVGQALRPGEGIAVVDVYPERVADLRDIAHDLQEATGLDTVIVQAPLNVSAVSGEYSRAAIESSQRSIAPGTAQVDLLAQFHAGVDAASEGGGLPWGLILAAIVVFCVLCAAVALRSARADSSVVSLTSEPEYSTKV
ncbi:DUF6676 family protein [uncultured Corynebacterium sp.]|uniref:Rv1476 family membrane protein n=1 Tax=uncultured Corynebacterium sp. TaxID=159447 RepID=UPI0025E6A6FE|nr:DUF6676 family protein [uncultured Corynebacterium sp.]